MSPAKINTFDGSFGCRRKYFYKYIAWYDQKPSINFPIGNIPHKTLEMCFKLKLHLNHEAYSDFRRDLLKLHDSTWQEKVNEIKKFNPTPAELETMLSDSRHMVLNWLHTYLREDHKDPTPLVEQQFWAHNLKMMCKIDYVGKGNSPGIVYIKDYKAGKSNKMYKDTKLQLIFNWICYKEKFPNTNPKVAAQFLRFGDRPVFWTPTKEEIQWALDKVEFVRKNTRSTDINDYPCTCGGKCQEDFILNENAGYQRAA